MPRRREHRDVLVAAHPYCGACEIAYTSSTSPPVTVTAPSGSYRRRVGGQPALRHHPRASTSVATRDRDVEVEDVLPAGVAGQQHRRRSARRSRPLAPSRPRRRAPCCARRPRSNMFITIDSAAGSITAAPRPCTPRMTIRKFTAGQPAGQRGHGEKRQPRHEDRRAAEQVGGPPTEQQEPAEGERVGGHHPLQFGPRSADRGRSWAMPR